MALNNELNYGISFDANQLNNKHAPDINRYLGGYGRTVDSHPYVKGYFYVFFGFPSSIFINGVATPTGDSPIKGVHSINSIDALSYTLSAAEGYTPPGDRQVKTEDLMGQGGVDASFMTGQTIDRNFSIQYRDYWGSPIFRVHRQWTQYLNPYYGGSTLATDFAAKEYKGTCMIIQTKPITRVFGSDWVKNDIIKVDFFDGVFPVTDLKSAYDSNITDNSIARPTVQYRFDGFPLDETNPLVMEKALILLQSAEYTRHNSSPAIFDDLITYGSPHPIVYPNNA
jgi:hypothetical protein